MERLILVLSAFVIVALGGVRADECTYANFTTKYGECYMKYGSAVHMKVSSRDASHCTRVSNELMNCLKTMLDRCKGNSALKLFQLGYSSGHIQKSAKYVCDHIDDVIALAKCATNHSRYAKCMGNAVTGAADFCTRLNALVACTTQFYEKCTATQREVAKKLYFMKLPGDCSTSRSTNRGNNANVKTGVGRASLALPSLVLLYALTCFLK